MERIIKDMQLCNMRTGAVIGAIKQVSSSGRIVGADNFGTMDMTVHWQMDARGESREFVDSRIRPVQYKINVLSDVYDNESKLGDKVYIALYRETDTQYVVSHLYGILCSIERDRFERNDTTLYSTAYTIYSDNPLWRRATSAYPSNLEEQQMSLVAQQEGALSTSASTLVYTLGAFQTNVKRGVKLVFSISTTSATYPYDIEITINGHTFTITVTALPSDIIFVFGESAVYCNCEMAEKGAVRTQALDTYGDFSIMHIDPIQWEDKQYTISYRALADVAGTMSVSLYMIQGEYF